MAQIVFYTKLGCATAAKQIDLLQQAGHTVDVRDLLAHDWTEEELLTYFGTLPVVEWFNVKSPRVRDGEIEPAAYAADGALALMLADHLLIHRPLMEAAGERRCGFDPEAIHGWIGLGETVYRQNASQDFNSCSQTSPHETCP